MKMEWSNVFSKLLRIVVAFVAELFNYSTTLSREGGAFREPPGIEIGSGSQWLAFVGSPVF